MSLTLPELRLPQRDELKVASVKFLDDVKVRFGANSVELFDIHKSLDLFSQRALSKKETHKAILNTLEGHFDLRKELMDILRHPAARWAPDDFDLPTESTLNTTPQFLQPAHEPQMRVPTLSSWFPLPQQDQLTNFTTFDGYEGFSGQPSLASSPSLLVPRTAQHPDLPAFQWADKDLESMYSGIHDVRIVPPHIQTAFRNPWQGESNFADAWTNDDAGFSLNTSNSGAHFEFREAPAHPFNDDLQVSSAYPQYAGPYATPTLLQHETPQSLSPPHATYNITPSPVDQDLFYAAKVEEQLRAPSTPSSQSPGAAQTLEAAVEVEHTSFEDHSQSIGELFIHALCGKGFATLAGVKKHHWGKKINNLATTTGCWAKHKKPSVAWDDHPSCKEGRPTSSQKKFSVSQPKSLSAVDVTQLRSIPGFPTLEDLPHTVAQTVNAGGAAEFSAQEPDIGQHTHRLASRSRFDSLLTAVNVVSQIEAPKPEGRTESIALHLDAQVTAAEHYDPYLPYEPPKASSTRPQYRPIAPAALNITAGDSIWYDRSETPRLPVNYKGEEQCLMSPSDVAVSHVNAAILQPFQALPTSSSEPVRKKRKV